MINKMKLTERELEILLFLQEKKGGHGTCTLIELGSTKNHYMRCNKLINLGYLTCKKKNGEATIYTLTNLGKSIINLKNKNL